MKKYILSAAVFVMMLVSLAGCYWGFATTNVRIDGQTTP
jgi:hypothetical protein